MQDIPLTELGAVATIVAALISGLIAFFSLIISKEQKISDFRQQWIDSLRIELSEFLNAASNIAMESAILKEKVTNKNDITLDEIASSNFRNVVTLATVNYHRILLRLNPEEHVVLVTLIKKMELGFSNHVFLTDSKKFDPLYNDISEEAQKVLKLEWTKVKKGERFYVFSKWGSLIVVSLMVLIMALHFLFSRHPLSFTCMRSLGRFCQISI